MIEHMFERQEKQAKLMLCSLDLGQGRELWY